MLLEQRVFKYYAESLGMGGSFDSIAEQPCFEMKTQIEPSAEEGRYTR